ncbi:MAG: Gfo/Idh/MocA family oxidoreductase [Candidatus Peribacteraceae bacterium]|nr:Gfo/Idh/MocA family oxidoreductase [Candidatus Peribacteraceae bacterium]MDD5741908.1 Gfo/Idh/MocA family oxidoreductase [Candidatus Peribacteraceae bacterium]
MNILIVGLGSIAKKHVAALRATETDATIFALRSSPDAEVFENVRNIRTLEELPVTPDFAIISNPTHLHLPSIRQMLPLRCPLFIEKPVVRTVAEAEQLLTLLPADAVTYVACHLRHHPCLQFVREQLLARRPQVNEVSAYCGSFLPEWVPGKDWKKSFRFDPAQSGGVHMELIHEMDYIHWVFGTPAAVSGTVRSVSSLHMPAPFGSAQGALSDEWSRAERGVERAPDFAHYVLTYDTFAATITLNYYRRDAKRTLEIVFGDQTWLVDLLRFTVEANGKQVFFSPLKTPDLYRLQMEYFLRCLKTGGQPMNSVQEACGVLRAALQV